MKPGKKQQKKGHSQQPGPHAYDYLKVPTNKQIHQETSAATNMAYGPTERQIKANKRASAQRTKNIGNWWNEYLATVSGAQQDTANAYAQAGTQTQGLIQSGSAIDNANTAQLNTQAQEAAALRGQSADAAVAANTQTANSAQAQRNYLLGAMGGATAARGANQYSYLADKRRVGAGQRASSMQTEAKRGASMLGDLASLKKERGDYAVKTLGEKQGTARDYLIQRKAFNLDKQNSTADRQLQREEGDANREIDWYNANTGRKNAESGGESGGLTPSEKRGIKQGRANAMVTVKNLYSAAKKPPQTPEQWAAFTQLVAAEEEISPQEAQWAVNRFRKRVAKKTKGGLLPETGW